MQLLCSAPQLGPESLVPRKPALLELLLLLHVEAAELFWRFPMRFRVYGFRV